MNFAKHLAEDRRRIILHTLSVSPGYCCNAYLLQQMLSANAHNIAIDTLTVELATLQEWGLVTVAEVGTVPMATLTQRGADVAADRAVVPGVARRQPGA